jgi:hypothetical protein
MSTPPEGGAFNAANVLMCGSAFVRRHQLYKTGQREEQQGSDEFTSDANAATYDAFQSWRMRRRSLCCCSYLEHVAQRLQFERTAFERPWPTRGVRSFPYSLAGMRNGASARPALKADPNGLYCRVYHGEAGLGSPHASPSAQRTQKLVAHPSKGSAVMRRSES